MTRRKILFSPFRRKYVKESAYLISTYSRVRNKRRATFFCFVFFPGTTSLLKGPRLLTFGLFIFFLLFYIFFLWLCITNSNYLLFHGGLRLLCLPNVPGATFIPIRTLEYFFMNLQTSNFGRLIMQLNDCYFLIQDHVISLVHNLK